MWSHTYRKEWENRATAPWDEALRREISICISRKSQRNFTYEQSNTISLAPSQSQPQHHSNYMVQEQEQQSEGNCRVWEEAYLPHPSNLVLRAGVPLAHPLLHHCLGMS